ncbi:MAG: PAS domain S-box protein, partial [Rhodocyclaceae bacterium]|nr:PAS domain S-box protein [Rhodocyclaceae bacterium]
MTSPPLRFHSARWLAAAFFLLAAGVGALWYSAISTYEASVLRERGRELQAIGALKIDFIHTWLDERRSDAAVLSGVTSAAPNAMPTPAMLESYRAEYGHDAVLFFDPAGTLRVSTGNPPGYVLAAAADSARAAMESGQTFMLRTYLGGGDPRHVDLDIATPVIVGGGKAARLAGVLVFHLSPRTHLDPLLGKWPGQSESGETFVVEQREGEIIYLSSLMHADASLLRRLVSDPPLPAAMAARGQQGVTEGLDYRGMPVLAAIGQVPGMPWFVVAKLDRAEILEPVRREALWSGALSALLVLALGLAMLAGWRRNQSELTLAQQVATAEALRASEAHFRKLHENGWDFNLLFDRAMVISYASPTANRNFGRSLTGEPITTGTAQVHPNDVAKAEAARRAALAAPGVPQHFEHRLAREDDRWWTVEASFTNHFDDPDIAALAYTGRNISGRVEAERRLRESEERYRFLFELSPDAVFVHRNNRILFANNAAEQLFHAGTSQALVGRDWHEIVASEDWPRTEARVAALLNGEEAFLKPTELRYLTLDGPSIQVEATAARIVIDGLPAIMSVSRDISERRQ